MIHKTYQLSRTWLEAYGESITNASYTVDKSEQSNIVVCK